MSLRSTLLPLAAALLLGVAPGGNGQSGSSSVRVTVVGVPAGHTLMARWLDTQLFVRTVPPLKDGSPFAFSVQIPAGQGRLQLWVLTMGQPGTNTATTVKTTIRSGRRYTLAVTSDSTSQLRATLAEDAASEIARAI
jgi:hypothetical protein